MTEREKQIKAVYKVLTDGDNQAAQTDTYCGRLIDALAPWLKESQDIHVLNQRIDRLERVTGSAQVQHEHEMRLATLESGGMDAKSPPKPSLTDRYSVSIMRAKGSKWHAVVNDIDWVAAIEYADRWFGDPEVQQVRVENESEPAMEPVYLKRKP